MIQTKPIIADPLRLYELGLRNLLDMAMLVHIGRCGIVGTKRQAIADYMRVSYDTARSGVDRLFELKLIACASRDNGPGSAHNLVCTVRGWKLLTQPADFTMFPYSQIVLQQQHHATRKKSRKETLPENQKPAAAAAAASVDLGGGGDDDHPANPAADSLAECPAALGGEASGDAACQSGGETDNDESAARV